MTTPSSFSRIGFAAGLKSIGDAQLDAFAARLAASVDPASISANDGEFAAYALRTKLLVYMPLIQDRVTRDSNPVLWTFYDCRRALTKICQPIMEEVYDILSHKGIEVMAYKGADMLHYYGNAVGERFSIDADPMVRFDDLDRVDLALKESGFIVVHIDRSRLNAEGTSLWTDPVPQEDIDWVRQNHHETHPYFKILEIPQLGEHIDIIRNIPAFSVVEGRIFAFPNIDVHWSIGSGVEEGDVWEEPRRSVRLPSGTVVSAISAELNLCLQCGRAYSIAVALQDDTSNYTIDAFRIALHPDGLDWDRVMKYATKYRIEAGLYHVLDWLNVMRPGSVPNDVVERLKAYLLDHREYDLGDHLSRVLGFIPEKRLSFV